MLEPKKSWTADKPPVEKAATMSSLGIPAISLALIPSTAGCATSCELANGAIKPAAKIIAAAIVIFLQTIAPNF